MTEKEPTINVPGGETTTSPQSPSDRKIIDLIKKESDKIEDDDFMGSLRAINSISDMIADSSLISVSYKVNNDILKQLDFLKEKDQSINNYLIKKLLDVFDYKLLQQGERTRSIEDWHSGHAENYITNSVNNLFKYGLLTTSDFKDNKEIQYLTHFDIFVDENKKNYACLVEGDEFEDWDIDGNGIPGERLEIADEGVRRMGQDKELQFILIDISSDMVGVFDKNGSLYKFFRKDVMDSTLKLVMTDIHDISEFESQFLQESSSNYSEQDKSEILEAFRLISNLQLRTIIENDLRIKFSDYSTREQIWFLNYLKGKSVDEIESLKPFVEKFGANGVRCFLSLEHGGFKMGETILKIGEKLKPEDAQAVFALYGDIINVVDQVDEKVKEVFLEGQNIELNKLREVLLVDAARLLDEIGKTDPTYLSKALDKLVEQKPGVYLKAGIIKCLVDEAKSADAEVNISSILGVINGLEPKTYKTSELSKNDKEEMTEMFTNNWQSQKSIVGQEATHKIISEFKELLKSEDKSFLVLRDKKEDQMIAFIRLDPSEKEWECDASSLNIRDYVRGHHISETILTVIDEKAKEGLTILGTAFPRLPICPHYIEDYKFNAYGFTKKYGENVPFFELSRNDQENQSYLYKEKDPGEIINGYKNNEIIPSQDHYIFRYDFRADQEYKSFTETAEKLFSDGYILTRFIQLEAGQSYLVFESKKELR